MELVKKDISLLSYNNIKGFVDSIDIEKELNNEDLETLIRALLEDKRKNVINLGARIRKNKEKLLKEIKRVKDMYEFDRSFGEYRYVAGVDEVGRGPLAGPIVACAVILDPETIDDELILGLNDSKKLSEKKREELALIIKERALAYYIASSSNEEIDNKGIGYSNNAVFLEACTSLEIEPDLVLSDGYLVKNIKFENKSVIKGDTRSACIAAASIVAKVYRDNLMKEYSKKYPNYYFEENAGYGTTKHVEAIKKYGPCKIHRMSFLTRIL
ncbi:ribonuclease HII [Clostridium paraputrificum]|uniref:ribonuclease HII n=1 Tax=Clostridium TaxID=1485 RepID=UPI003D3252DF